MAEIGHFWGPKELKINPTRQNLSYKWRFFHEISSNDGNKWRETLNKHHQATKAPRNVAWMSWKPQKLTKNRIHSAFFQGVCTVRFFLGRKFPNGTFGTFGQKNVSSPKSSKSSIWEFWELSVHKFFLRCKVPKVPFGNFWNFGNFRPEKKFCGGKFPKFPLGTFGTLRKFLKFQLGTFAPSARCRSSKF